MSVDVSGTPSVELVADLDQQVRSVVRREGVDPQLDVTRVRRIAEDVVRAHDERSLTGVVTPVPDPVGVIGELVERVSGFGPLQRFLDDEEVEEIWINDPSRVFVARNGRHELTNVILSRAEVQELVERMLKSSGRRIDLSQPFVDAMLPQGHRLHVVHERLRQVDAPAAPPEHPLVAWPAHRPAAAGGPPAAWRPRTAATGRCA